MRKWQMNFSCRNCGSKAYPGSAFCSSNCMELFRRPNPVLGKYTPEQAEKQKH